MALDVEAEVLIDRPRGEVAAVATDPANDARWIGGVERARALGHGPVAPGSQVERTARFLGRRIDYVTEVVELEPGALLRMRSVRGPFPMDVTYAFADAGPGTRAAIRVRGEARGAFRLAGPLLGPIVRRSVAADLRRLKALVEGHDGDG
ncbi:MAG TPA: SRPBCC family protein [Miltoncostaeaceae bacterium]|nr:SRPBCC family protein [Miltoncostaeaceae bacterium]